MTWADKQRAVQHWFTVRRRRCAGSALIAVSLLGSVLYPSGYWVSVGVPGVIWLFSTWPLGRLDKR